MKWAIRILTLSFSIFLCSPINAAPVDGIGTFMLLNPGAIAVTVPHITHGHSLSSPVKKKFGISIVLYRVPGAGKIDELPDLERYLDKSTSVNLYKITQDLGIIFMNTNEPYNNTTTIPYRLLFGNYVEKKMGYRTAYGFVSITEVATICDWIKKHRIDSFDGFSKMYDHLSKEAKKELIDIGADDKKGLYQGYVKPLTQFYFAALANRNSIVFCAE